MANPDGSAAMPLGPVAKTALGPALFVTSEISCSEEEEKEEDALLKQSHSLGQHPL